MPKLSSVTIRPAKEDDVPAISMLLVRSFNHGLGDKTTGKTRGWMQYLLYISIQADLRQRFRTRSPEHSCLVAVHADYQRIGLKTLQSGVVGAVELSVHRHNIWVSSSRYLYLSNLAVCQEYRRQGIAYKLLNECESMAIQWGFSDLYLHVRENNTAARQLYTRLGYRVKRVDFNLATLILRQPQTLFLYKQLRANGA